MRGKCLPYKKLAIFSISLFQNQPGFETSSSVIRKYETETPFYHYI
jgi:hypothetical protein